MSDGEGLLEETPNQTSKADVENSLLNDLTTEEHLKAFELII